MGKKLILVPGLLVLATILAWGTAWGGDISVGTGLHEYSDGNSGGGFNDITTTDPSLIEGTYTIEPTDSVTNGNTVTVTGTGTLDIEATGNYTDVGGTSFQSGSTLQNAGMYTNAGNTDFATGSIYVKNDPGSQVINQGVMSADTSMININGFLGDLRLTGTSSFTLTGAVGNLNNDEFINKTAAGAGTSVVILNTNNGTAYTKVDTVYTSGNLGAALEIHSDSAFSGSVDAYNITVGDGATAMTATFNGTVKTIGNTTNFQVANDGTAQFTGAGANLAQGRVIVDSGGELSFDSSARLSSSGTVSNSGTITFTNTGVYAGSGAITNLAGGVINYDTAMTGLATAFANTSLDATSILNITGSTTVSQNLILANAAATSEVYVKNGAIFNGIVNVHNASMTVEGATATVFNGAVTAADVTVAAGSAGTTFNNALNADLTANAATTFTSAATFSGHSITVGAAGTLSNFSNNIIISGGEKLTNTGTVTNAGTITNNGTYEGNGILNNNYYFINNGVFKNDTAGGNVITNNTNGVMWFNANSTYTTGGNDIINHGIIHGNTAMSGTSLRDLMADTDLQAGATFNIVATSNSTMTGNYGFAATTNTSIVNVNPGSSTITLADNTNINAGQAFLNLEKGKVVLSNNTSLTTTNTFTAKEDSHIDFVTAGTGYVSNINADSAVFNKSFVDVGNSNTLNINTTNGVSFNTGTHVRVAEGGTVVSDKAIVFGDDTKMEFTATPAGISQIIASTGNITVSANGRTEVLINGNREDILNEIFLWAQTGQVINDDKLYNPLYRFDIDTSLGGEGVVVAGFRSTIDSMADAFGGYQYISINKKNGGEYTDQILTTDWGKNNNDLRDYLQQAGQSSLGRDKAFAAYGQLYGEYAAYSYTALTTSNENFRDTLHNRLGLYRGPDVACVTCVEYVDPGCNTCGGEEIIAAAPVLVSGGGRGGNLWASGFGDWSRQKDTKYVHGYDYSAGGGMIGYDYVNDRFTIGVAGGYTNGSLKVNKMNTTIDSDILNVGVYGAFNHESGAYVMGHAAYGYGWNEYGVGMVLGGSKHGEYTNQSYAAGLEIGYRAEFAQGFHAIPSIGVDFNHVSQESWNETIHRSGNAPILANSFERQRYTSVELPVGMRLNKIIDMGDMTLIPEVRGAWIYQANDRRPSIHSGYLGSGSYTTMHTVDCGTTRGMIGGGVKAMFSSSFDVSLDYALNFKGGYRDHRFTGTLNLAF